MEENINIVEILKDKPQGTKLYSSACGKCKLEEVDDKSFKISFYNSKFGFMNGGEGYLDKNGKLYDDGECVVFPSKEMRDWSKFAWNQGDVLVNSDKDVHVIFEKFEDDSYTKFIGKYHTLEESYNEEVFQMETSAFEKDNDGDAQTYISTIEERLGGKLNRETLEVEKYQPEFKDGDIVLVKSYMLGINTNSMIAIFRKEKENDKYKFSQALCESNEHNTYFREGHIVLSPSDITIFRHADDSEKKKLFDALEKKGKAWDAKKKQIVDLKPNVELKPFDKVLVRDFESQAWQVSLFSYKDSDSYYCCNGCAWNQCIPYIGNESLLGTTKDVDG